MGVNSPGIWIKRLGLIPHPEGGYYRQTYISEASFGKRRASTAIYFLLQAGDFSAFHRIQSDEVWHFYTGDPVEVLVIESDRSLRRILLGPNLEGDQTFQAVVSAGLWFASRVAEGGSFALTGCTVSPGFDFEDFELAKREKLMEVYPQHAKLIGQLTRT